MDGDQRDQVRGAPGKLKAALRHWLDGGDSRDDTDDALAAFGLVRDGADEVEDAPFKVFALNWPTLTIFWATWNQWRKVAIKESLTRECIDWSQVESALKLSGIKRREWPYIFEGLQVLEAEALRLIYPE